jgi:hypothetical protein
MEEEWEEETVAVISINAEKQRTTGLAALGLAAQGSATLSRLARHRALQLARTSAGLRRAGRAACARAAREQGARARLGDAARSDAGAGAGSADARPRAGVTRRLAGAARGWARWFVREKSKGEKQGREERENRGREER